VILFYALLDRTYLFILFCLASSKFIYEFSKQECFIWAGLPGCLQELERFNCYAMMNREVYTPKSIAEFEPLKLLTA